MVSYLDIDDDLLFPDSDGQPMADNTEQYEWIVKIKRRLRYGENRSKLALFKNANIYFLFFKMH